MIIQEIVTEKKIHLTEAQRRAAQYLMDHYEEAIFLTASRLARKAKVSDATVFRLAQALGFDGYPALQRRLRDNFHDRLTTVARLGQTVQHIRNESDVLTKIIQEDIRNLSETLQGISARAFRQAVADLRDAKRIYIVGLRGAHGPALTLSVYLTYLKREAYAIVPGWGDVWDILQGIGRKDLIIGISLPRYTRLTADILEYAREQGSRVGAITDSPASPLARNADWVLPVHSKLDSFIESFTAAMSLINALLTALSIQDPEETLKALKEQELLWRQKNIYIMPHSTNRKRRTRKASGGSDKQSGRSRQVDSA